MPPRKSSPRGSAAKRHADRAPARKKKPEAKGGTKRPRPVSSKKPGSGQRSKNGVFPVVAIGASAGGLEAIKVLLRHLTAGTGMAFVYLQHLDPHHESLLTTILEKETEMDVVTVKNRTRLRPNCVHVLPPNVSMTVAGGVLHLKARDEARVPPMPIDRFLRSLAEDQGHRAIAVLLSGSGSDGALGMRAIKEHGGITIAQDESAQYRGMPSAPIATKSVDLVMPPEAIAQELIRLGQGFVVTPDGDVAFGEEIEPDEKIVAAIFSLLQDRHAVDFAAYKPMTTTRRIRRRMTMNRIRSFDEYLQFLRGHPEEITRLYQDLLIRVTGFFRDPEVFDFLADQVFPALFEERRASGESIRVWVPGCATGEEVYSIAMLLIDLAERLDRNVPVQLFGTDVSESALEIARAGVYPENIAQGVPLDMLRNRFARAGSSYRISRAIRDLCVFARQDLTRDPPFSKLDLISCRNVLIYLDASLQRQVLTIFHYALKPGGILLLGSAESVGSSPDLFSMVNSRLKIYRKKVTPGTKAFKFRMASKTTRQDPPESDAEPEAPSDRSLMQQADRIVLHHFAPPGVLVNDHLEILQFRGRTSRFLEPAPGAPSFRLLKMAREGLLSELRPAISRVRKTRQPVRRTGIRMPGDGEDVQVGIEIIPIHAGGGEPHYLILFHEVRVPETESSKPARRARSKDPGDDEWLRRELDATRDYLQSIIEEQESLNDELQSANEEIQSSNEELQSTNEELETAKEELQSTNEELTTLNEELENRNQELDLVNNDLVNLLTAVDIPILMLGNDLRIRRFNLAAQKTLNLIPGDIGRPVSDLRTTLRIDDLEGLVTGVLDSLRETEAEVTDASERIFRLRVRPYRTLDGRIDGAVLTVENLGRTS